MGWESGKDSREENSGGKGLRNEGEGGMQGRERAGRGRRRGREGGISHPWFYRHVLYDYEY